MVAQFWPAGEAVSPKRRVSGSSARTLIVVLVAQSLAVAPLVTFTPPVSAEASDGSREGGEGCSPQEQKKDEQADADPEAQSPDESSDHSNPDASESSGSASSGETEGGDFGDGGNAAGDPGGTDGNGYEASMASNAASSAMGDGSFGESAGGSREPKVMAAEPIDLRFGDKVHIQVDYRGYGAAAPLAARVYHSNPTAFPAQITMPMGAGWHGYYDRTVQVLSASQVRLHRANGRTIDFNLVGGTWTTTAPAGVLTTSGAGWQYVNNRDQVEQYASNGRLISMTQGSLVTSMQYDGSNRLVRVVNPFGRPLGFSYDGPGRVATMTLPDGNALSYSYDGYGNLASVRFADGSVRQYLYENATFRNALTGVIDESGKRRLTWGYDAQGRANYGAYGNNVNAVTMTYNGSQVTSTDVKGTQRLRTFASVNGRTVLTNLQVGATADSPATSAGFASDGYGNASTYVATSGELQQVSMDGRGRTVSATRAAGTSMALPMQTTWHPVFRKPIQVVHAGVTRTASIDTYGRITQVTQSAGGTSATLLSRVFNAQGLLQSETDARGATTTYGYDASGNRTSVTDALGQTTYFQNFNAHGQAGRIQRSDGTVITRTYDTRGRLSSRTIAGRTSSFAYDAAGRLTQVTRPDGSWRTYSYDQAGNVTAINNHRGEWTLVSRDAAGLETTRATYTASGALAASVNRRYDSRNRLSQVIDARSNVTRLTYAADARPSGVVNGLGQSFTQSMDLLDRVTAQTQPNTSAMRQAGGAATVSVSHSWHPTTATYLGAVDTNNVATGYAYNAFNHRVAEAGNDAGTSTLQRNVAGDVLSTTDARGATLNLTRDAFGRVTAITPASGTAVNITYVPGRRDALPAAMSDGSGSTAWTYDSEGRPLLKTQTTLGGTKQVSYTRDSLGRVVGMRYPSGMTVGVAYSSDLVSSITVNGTTLLSNLAYQPHSQTAKSWSWGNGSSFSRSFDTDGNVTSVTLGSALRTYSYDAAGRITSHTDTGAAGTRISSFGYDEAGQLTTYNGPAGSFNYGYDANGNRRVVNGYQYVFQAGSNRLLSTQLRSYSYNADGTIANDGTWSFGYDNFGRWGSAQDGGTQKLVRSYNGQGMRVYASDQMYFSGTQTAPTAGGATQPAPSAAQGKSGITASASAKAIAAAARGYWAVVAKKTYLHADGGQLLGEYDSVSGYSQETIWFNGQPVGTLINGVLYYVYADNIGAPRSLVRASDNLEVWRWDSEPFGSTFPSSPSPANAITYNLRFPGQQYDDKTMYHQNWMRDYDPQGGRYLQPDPIGLAGGMKRYAYVGGNPVSAIDSDGLSATVCLYPGAAGFGHVGVGINSRSTSGFYPRSDAPGNPVTGTAGVVRRDTKSATQCKMIETTPEQDRQMFEYIKVSSQGTPSDYALLTNNCTNYVRDVLLQGNLSIPATSPRPDIFFRSLPGTPIRP